MFKEVMYSIFKGGCISLEEITDKYYTNRANVTTLIGKNESATVEGDSIHTSANTGIHSDKPIGMKGTGTQLGADVLQKFWDDLSEAWKQYPGIPAPPVINMALNGIKQSIIEAAAKAKASCAKALK